MRSPIFIMVFILAAESVFGKDRFLISAPNVFHVGVKERVHVQMSQALLNTRVTLYLEHEITGELMSEKASIVCTTERRVQTVELEIDREKMSRLPPFMNGPPYLLVVGEILSISKRQIMRVLVSQHRGYIFIQTDQPIYNPTQKGNRIKNTLHTTRGGIYSGVLDIPDVSEMGVWKIVAHYLEDEKNAVTQTFQVKKFVLPSFEVTVQPEQGYFLLTTKQFTFTISALYSHGERIKGAFHCRFGVKEETQEPDDQKEKTVFIRGLELTGSIQDGKGSAVLLVSQLSVQLQAQHRKTLSELDQSRAQLYMAVSVTDVVSGELQEAEVSLPIVSQRYSIDLSHTRSHFIPGMPLDVLVVVRLPNGSPAAEVPVTIDVPKSRDKTGNIKTNQEGAVSFSFNLKTVANDDITVKVTVDGQQASKVVKPASSPSGNSYLYLSVSSEVQTVGNALTVTYTVINGPPDDGFMYYMVFSRGALSKQGALQSGVITSQQLPITADMTPSFRLIGYYYNQYGDIIAGSVWVDVKDECEKKVKISTKTNQYRPGTQAKLDIDGDGQTAKVALLVVDKAIYALNAHNKLTPKQVFASMQSYDLGCSYGGGSDTPGVLNEAGLSFTSNSEEKSMQSRMRKGFDCGSGFRRQRRSLDLKQQIMSIKYNYTDVNLQECCAHGFSQIPMKRTCEQRAKRVSLTNKDPACVQAFRQCCLQGEKLREKKRQEDTAKGQGRTASDADIEDFFFDNSIRTVRRYFPPSFSFRVIDVVGRASELLSLPDSITTWEIQAVSLSTDHGFCVAEPHEIQVSKPLFVSLRLPYSVKQYEQLSIVAVVSNYGTEGTKPAELALHMEQNKMLCSPGSTSTTAYVNITVAPQASQAITFSAVPMETGSIPIKILLFDREEESASDAIEKILIVRTEGIEKRDEKTHFLDLNERREMSLTIDGTLPDNTVPDSYANIFVRIEGEVFGQTTAQTLLSPEGVAALLKLPHGCAEQTMKRMAPTALALRYLDLSQRWFELPTGTRDVALRSTEQGYMKILTFKKSDGSYGAWIGHPTSHWLTGLVVKVLSLVAELQTVATGEMGMGMQVVSEEDIRQSVRYLLSKQKEDGSFTDPHPVIHREMQGGIGGIEGDVSMTAFITIALNRSFDFLTAEEKNNVKFSISKSTDYLLSRVDGVERPYAVALTAYCLSVCLSDITLAQPAWKKLQGLATQGEDGCRVWNANTDLVKQEHGKWIPSTEAITIETTAYALLTAVAHKDSKWSDSAACWITSQENYGGGFKSTQDTIVALEALSEYALSKPPPPVIEVDAEFTVPGKSDKKKLTLDNKGLKVETELNKLMGNQIIVQLNGQGKAKMKVIKAYHLMEATDNCDFLSIKVNVEGKVQYTAKILDNYDYYGEDYGDGEKGDEEDVPRSAIEWFDARSRRRRDTEQSLTSQNAVEYEVCVSHSHARNLTGMAIADVTLLSGFEAQTEDLDKLKEQPEQYISHYEVSYERVLLYFNEIRGKECITFGAIQRVPVGLLQPAPASFYDYYEPDRKCTVFYSAPRRSKMVSTLCSGDVCQCAERPCHKQKMTFGPLKIKKEARIEHACFYPTVDYSYIVEVVNMSVKGNFEHYTTDVIDVLRTTGDMDLGKGQVRVFTKRLMCKGELTIGEKYLIMGKDGATTDSNGQKQYLLELNTWIEEMPNEDKCNKSLYKFACKGFRDFVSQYRINGCTM